jgi:hypothetical protein
VEGDGVVDLDVSWVVPADLRAVDALARLQIAATQRGRWVQLHGADAGLAELVEFVGLGDVLHLCHCGRSYGPRREPPRARADCAAEPPA